MAGWSRAVALPRSAWLPITVSSDILKVRHLNWSMGEPPRATVSEGEINYVRKWIVSQRHQSGEASEIPVGDARIMLDNAVCSPIILTRWGAKLPIQIALKSIFVSYQPVPGTSELYDLTLNELGDWMKHLDSVMVSRKKPRPSSSPSTPKQHCKVFETLPPLPREDGMEVDSTSPPLPRQDGMAVDSLLLGSIDAETQIPMEGEIPNETKEVWNMPAISDLVRDYLQANPEAGSSAQAYLAVEYYRHLVDTLSLASEALRNDN